MQQQASPTAFFLDESIFNVYIYISNLNKNTTHNI